MDLELEGNRALVTRRSRARRIAKAFRNPRIAPRP